ncbi:MAG TPA: DNA repair protein RadC [Cyclobacteriaceae bacterium]|nr:DNA repair protein RadC [Cyclobacteriaceae bacterium]
MKVKKTMDGPREKLLEKGADTLTNAELIAVLLGSGTPSQNVFEIAKKVMTAGDNNMSSVAELPVRKLTKIHGVGQFKAISLKAALELARRAKYEKLAPNFKVLTSNDAYKVLGPMLGDLSHEEFWVALLDRRSKVLLTRKVGQGGLTSTVADPRIIFKLALDEEATSIIVAHNHPSGSLNPSQADIELTRKLVEGGKLLDIQLVDHLIISGNNYCSFADSGLL